MLAHRAWLATELGTPDAATCAAFARRALDGDLLLRRGGQPGGLSLLCASVDLHRPFRRGRGGDRARCARTGRSVARSGCRRGPPGTPPSSLSAPGGSPTPRTRHGWRSTSPRTTSTCSPAARSRSSCGRSPSGARSPRLTRSWMSRAWRASSGTRSGRSASSIPGLCSRSPRVTFLAPTTRPSASGRLRIGQGRPNPVWTPWRATAALALAHQGQPAEAAALAAEELALAERFGAPAAILTADARRELWPKPTTRRDWSSARPRSRRPGDRGSLLELSRSGWNSAMPSAGSGRRVQARESLQLALADADRIGATLLGRASPPRVGGHRPATAASADRRGGVTDSPAAAGV